jgi:hypothetical protein
MAQAALRRNSTLHMAVIHPFFQPNRARPGAKIRMKRPDPGRQAAEGAYSFRRLKS